MIPLGVNLDFMIFRSLTSKFAHSRTFKLNTDILIAIKKLQIP